MNSQKPRPVGDVPPALQASIDRMVTAATTAGQQLKDAKALAKTNMTQAEVDALVAKLDGASASVEDVIAQ